MEAGRLRELGLLAALVAAACAQEESEHHPRVSKVNAGISVMLLGSIGFMMALFELTHCHKKTMAKYAWKAISATISIFSAVLVFQGVNGLVEAYFLEGASELLELVVSVVHALVWFTFLQIALAVITGVLPLKFFNPRLDDLEIMESRLKTFAILLGHITGFAAIHAFATFQQQLPRHLLAAVLVAPLGWGAVYYLGRLTDRVREHVALIGDNKKERHEEMWDEETEETEDDVAGLAVSFVFVQSVRFALGGVLPNAEGEEPEEVIISHSDGQSAALIGVGVLLALVEIVRVIYIKIEIPRVTPQGKNITAMTFSWCIFFGVDWYLSANCFEHEQGMMKQVSLALCVTVVALLMIYFLEQIQDLKHVDDRMDEALRAVVNAIGILIGFAWEKAFDVAVAEITETVHILPAVWTKMLLAICLAGTVVPAWYRHILPNILLYEEEERQGVERALEAEGLAERRELARPLLEGAAGGEEAAAEQYLKKIEELEGGAARAGELERRNRELEASLGKLSAELGELQALADLLQK